MHKKNGSSLTGPNTAETGLAHDVVIIKIGVLSIVDYAITSYYVVRPILLTRMGVT